MEGHLVELYKNIHNLIGSRNGTKKNSALMVLILIDILYRGKIVYPYSNWDGKYGNLKTSMVVENLAQMKVAQMDFSPNESSPNTMKPKCVVSPNPSSPNGNKPKWGFQPKWEIGPNEELAQMSSLPK